MFYWGGGTRGVPGEVEIENEEKSDDTKLVPMPRKQSLTEEQEERIRKTLI